MIEGKDIYSVEVKVNIKRGKPIAEYTNSDTFYRKLETVWEAIKVCLPDAPEENIFIEPSTRNRITRMTPGSKRYTRYLSFCKWVAAKQLEIDKRQCS